MSENPPTIPTGSIRLGTGTVLLFMTGLWLLVTNIPEATGWLLDLSPTCVWKALTHVPCPTCGLTRGVLAGLKGDYLLAWQYNPIALVLVVLGPGLALLTLAAPQVWRRYNQMSPGLAWMWVFCVLGGVWAYKLLGPPQYW